MESKKEKIQKFIEILILVILVFLFLLIFTPFTVPIIMAGFVAFGSEPFIQKIRFKSRRRKYFSVGLTTLTLIFIVGPLILFTLKITNGLRSLSSDSLKNSQFFQALFTLWEKGQTYSGSLAHSAGLDSNLFPQKDELFAKVSPLVVEKTTQFLTALPDLVLSLFVFFCMLFVFIINATSIKEYFKKSQILPLVDLDLIIRTFQSSCSTILISTILIGALQAFIVATGSALFGFHEYFLIFAITFFLSFIPVIGAAPVAVVLALISFLLDNNGAGVGLIVVSVIAGTIDNVIKPFIFSSGEDNLNPVISLLGIIGAIVIFGLPGLLLGPLIIQVTLKLAPTLARHLSNN